MLQSPESKMLDSAGRFHKETIFWPQAGSQFAKSLIFCAESRTAAKEGHFIWVAISSYYSLFHFCVFLFYATPTLIGQQTLTRLIDARRDGVADPTRVFTHSRIPEHLKALERFGMTSELRERLIVARQIREFVNYRPTTEFDRDTLYFRSKEFSIDDVRTSADDIELLMHKSIKWLRSLGERTQIALTVASHYFNDFTERDDLLYKVWCPPRVLVEAKELFKRLPLNKVQGR